MYGPITRAMLARTDGDKLRILVFLADHDQLKQYLDYKKIVPQPHRRTARPWISVEVSSKDQEIPASENSKPRLDLISAHPSHHNRRASDPGRDVHTNVRPR